MIISTRRPSSWFDEQNGTTLLEHDITTLLPDSLPDFDYIIYAASIASPIYYRKFLSKLLMPM